MRPIMLTPKRMTWATYLDMPVALAPAASAQVVYEIVFEVPGLRHVGPFQPGEAQGWLVVLGVRSSGFMPVRDKDFRVPLGFGFPGRDVRSAQVCPRPSARTRASRPMSAAHADFSGPEQAGYLGRIHLHGLQLNHNDELTVLVVLTGSPARDSPRIIQEGSLIGGAIAARPPDSDESAWLDLSRPP